MSNFIGLMNKFNKNVGFVNNFLNLKKFEQEVLSDFYLTIQVERSAIDSGLKIAISNYEMEKIENIDAIENLLKKYGSIAEGLCKSKNHKIKDEVLNLESEFNISLSLSNNFDWSLYVNHPERVAHSRLGGADMAASIIDSIKKSLEERRVFFYNVRKNISFQLIDPIYKKCLLKSFNVSESKYFLDFLLGVSDDIYPVCN